MQVVESTGSLKKCATYKLIKMFSMSTAYSASYDDSYEADTKDRSHTQLFYDITNYTNNSKCTPSYCRDLYRVDSRDNLYWYSSALKAVPSTRMLQQPSSPSFPKSPQTLSPTIPKSPQSLYPPSPKFMTSRKSSDDIKSNLLTPPASPLDSPNPITIWSVECANFKCSRILKKALRPKVFGFSHTNTGAHSTFTCVNDKGLTGFSGEVNTPFDITCDQRYHWILSPNHDKWSLVRSNEPDRILVEFKKTEIENEFLIVFLEAAPYGWSPHIACRLSRYHSSKSESDQRRGSDTSSNGSNSIKSPLFQTSFMESDYLEDERYWHEFVLASTVAIQDEVNPKKRRLWRSK